MQAPSAEAGWSGKSVLIVDDYPSIRKSMRELLTGLGLTCREAENGVQAMERIKAFEAARN